METRNYVCPRCGRTSAVPANCVHGDGASQPVEAHEMVPNDRRPVEAVLRDLVWHGYANRGFHLAGFMDMPPPQREALTTVLRSRGAAAVADALDRWSAGEADAEQTAASLAILSHLREPDAPRRQPQAPDRHQTMEEA